MAQIIKNIDWIALYMIYILWQLSERLLSALLQYQFVCIHWIYSLNMSLILHYDSGKLARLTSHAKHDIQSAHSFFEKVICLLDMTSGTTLIIAGVTGCVPIWFYLAQYPVAAMLYWLLDWRIVPFSVNTALTSHLVHAGYLMFMLRYMMFINLFFVKIKLYKQVLL